MKREVALAIAAGTGAFLTTRVDAASIRASGFIDVHAGYGSNPFFSLTSSGPSPTVGTTLNGTIDRLTSRSSTELSAEADIDHFVKHYGSEENYSATLRHNQQISQFISLSGHAAYENAVNLGPSYSTKSADLQPQTDLLTVGQRTHRISGGIDGTWQPNEKNLFQGGLNASRATFGGGNANSYTQYGGSLGYLRTLNAHTQLGIQGGVTEVISTGNPNSRSYSLGLQWIQQINAIWKFNGGVSVLAQAIQGTLFKTVGFNADLCGNYPRITVCFTGSRQSAASGLGGLRTDTQGGARINYKLTPRSTVGVSATYDVSTAQSGTIPPQKYFDGAMEYRRTITPRLSGGFSLRGQRRDYGTLFSPDGNKVNAYTATANLVWKFGRIG